VRHTTDLGDYFIVAFVAIIFIGGVIGVFKFMKGKN